MTDLLPSVWDWLGGAPADLRRLTVSGPSQSSHDAAVPEADPTPHLVALDAPDGLRTVATPPGSVEARWN